MGRKNDYFLDLCHTTINRRSCFNLFTPKGSASLPILLAEMGKFLWEIIYQEIDEILM